MELTASSLWGIIKSIPRPVWKFFFDWGTRFYQKFFGIDLEWEIWDAPFYDEVGVKSAVVFRLSNNSSIEQKNITFSFELSLGNSKDISVRILPLFPEGGRLHMDQLVFNELSVTRKPNQRRIQFDLPPKSHYRVELGLDFSSGCSPIALFKHYEFSHESAKIRRKQRN